jgi:maleate cis-trans isomerase
VGCAWITFPLAELLEKEFGRPVVKNEAAAIWHARHLIKYWRPISGRRLLLASD